MDDAPLFENILGLYGGRLGKPSRKLLALLGEHGLIPEAIAYVSAHLLERDAWVSAITFYGESGVLKVNGKRAIPIALRDGLLIVGTCPNGDPVAVDVRDRIGEAGYIGHGGMWHAASVREQFGVLAPSLGQLARDLHEARLPLDYYEASQERRDLG